MRSSLLSVLSLMLLVGCLENSRLNNARLENAILDMTSNAIAVDGLADPADYRFSTPVRLTASGQPIAVEAPGFACPTMADVDGDGQDDLIVGQFAEGKMHFYRNVASAGTTPEFAEGTWIMTGSDPATVPGVW